MINGICTMFCCRVFFSFLLSSLFFSSFRTRSLSLSLPLTPHSLTKISVMNGINWMMGVQKKGIIASAIQQLNSFHNCIKLLISSIPTVKISLGEWVGRERERRKKWLRTLLFYCFDGLLTRDRRIAMDIHGKKISKIVYWTFNGIFDFKKFHLCS